MAFGRKTELFIGTFKNANDTQKGFLVEGLDYEFEITRSAEYYKDSATFTIYGPNEETIKTVMNDGVAVVFKAGYEDEGIGNIFVGQIATAYPESEGPESTRLVIICNSQRGAQYQLGKIYITEFFDEGTSYFDILKSIADYAGIPLSGASVLKEYKIDVGYIVTGTIRDAVHNFMSSKLRAIGGKVIISNNEMVYLDKNYNAAFDTAFLSFKSGLVSAQDIRDQKFQSSEDAFNENREYYLGISAMGDKELAKQKEIENSIQSPRMIQFVSLINPMLSIGTPVYIDARRHKNDNLSVVGKFYVTELKYNGDSYGNQWKIEGKAMERIA